MSKNYIFLVLAALAMAVISAMLAQQNLFSLDGMGYVVGSAAAAIGIAVVVAAIPAGVYWLVKRKRMPGLSATIWVLWFLVSSLGLFGNVL